MNHFYWFLKIADKKTGENLYPEFKKRVREGRVVLEPLNKTLLEVFGLLTYPTDSHPGEYLPWAYSVTGPRWSFRKVSKEEDMRDYTVVGEGKRYEKVDGRWMRLRGSQAKLYLDNPIMDKIASQGIIVGGQKTMEQPIPIICGIEFDRNTWIPSVNVLNKEGYIENLPIDAAVEVPAYVDAKGIHPQKIGSIPEALAAFTRTQVSIQKLLVEAYRTRSRNLLLQALLLDPIVDSYQRTEKFLDEMLDLQEDYLPKFK